MLATMKYIIIWKCNTTSKNYYLKIWLWL